MTLTHYRLWQARTKRTPRRSNPPLRKGQKSLRAAGRHLRHRGGGGSLQRRRREESDCWSKIQEPAAAGMAHQEPEKAARPEVHADVMGRSGFGWTLPVQRLPSRARRRSDLRWPTGISRFHQLMRSRNSTRSTVPKREKDEVLQPSMDAVRSNNLHMRLDLACIHEAVPPAGTTSRWVIWFTDSRTDFADREGLLAPSRRGRLILTTLKSLSNC